MDIPKVLRETHTSKKVDRERHTQVERYTGREIHKKKGRQRETYRSKKVDTERDTQGER